MRRSALLGMTFVFLFLMGYSANAQNEYSDKVLPAVESLRSHWIQIYKDRPETDGYFEIKNTRIVDVKSTDSSLFKDIDYVVEFTLYSDYFGTAPYYFNAGYDDSVVFYRDGQIEVRQVNIFKQHYMTYLSAVSADFPSVTEGVVDLKDAYNEILILK